MNLFPLYMTLSLRYNPTKQGIIKGTKNIPDTPKIISRDFTEHDLSYEYCVKRTEEILRANIANIQSKIVAIGLSGGTDSSLNTLILSENERISLKCFCIGFNDADDEFDDARIVAKLANCDYKEIVIEDVTDELPLMIWKFGAPKSNLWGYYNFKTVRDLGANTTLSGEGGDELFGGYYFRYVKYLQHIPKTPFERARRYILSRTRDWIPNQHRIFGSKFKKNKKLIFSQQDIISHFANSFSNKLHPLNQIFLADFNYKLRFDFNFVDSVFARTEKINMESTFLSQNMIKFATHIPHRYKMNKFTSKMILRNILKKLGAPKRIYNKSKQGWGMRPITVWQRGLCDKCERFLLDGTVVRDGWINKQWLLETHSFIEKNRNNEVIYPYINKMWDILSFEIFYRQGVLKESKNGKITNW